MISSVALAALQRRYGRKIELPEIASIDRRRALRMPLSDEQREILVATGEPQIKSIRLWAAREARDAWRIRRDCQRYAAARTFYVAVGVRASLLTARPRPRALSGRPARRERRTASRNGSRASGDDDGDPDGEPPVALAATRKAAGA